MNCKNGESFLKESLDSILVQTYKNWELIFVDNASKDKSKKIFDNYHDERFKYFNIKEEVNLGTARQVALQNCSGEFISFLDTDDIWFENKLEDQIELFKESDIGMVISNTIFFSGKKEKVFYLKAPPTGEVFYDLLKKYYISLETLICRKKYLDQLYFEFDEEYSMISDMDLTLRLSLICKLAYCPKILSKWRVHNKSDTWNKKDLFFSEQISLIEKLTHINGNDKNIKFLKSKKNFLNNIYFSLILNRIENEKSLNRIEIVKEILKKKMRFKNLIILFLLTLLPFKNLFFKFYRLIFSINP